MRNFLAQPRFYVCFTLGTNAVYNINLNSLNKFIWCFLSFFYLCLFFHLKYELHNFHMRRKCSWIASYFGKIGRKMWTLDFRASRIQAPGTLAETHRIDFLSPIGSVWFSQHIFDLLIQNSFNFKKSEVFKFIFIWF